MASNEFRYGVARIRPEMMVTMFVEQNRRMNSLLGCFSVIGATQDAAVTAYEAQGAAMAHQIAMYNAQSNALHPYNPAPKTQTRTSVIARMGFGGS